MLENLYGEKRTACTQAELNAVMKAHERFVSSRGGIRARLLRTDLSGLCLANRTLSQADFAGSALVGASMFGSNLERAVLYCADLQGCDLRHANLSRADLRGASLKGANLSFAQMDHADLRAAMMMYVTPTGVSIVDREGHGGNSMHGVDFTNCSMKGVSFSNAKLDGADFSGALLHGANFRNAKLTNAAFRGAVLTGVNLGELGVSAEALKGCITDVTAESLARANVLRGRLEAHQEWIASNGAKGSHCVLDGEDIRPLYKLVIARPLTGLSACNTIAIGMNFSGSQLQGAKFDGADLRDADFCGADLRGASFKGAKIAHACFEHADLRSLQLNSGRVCAVDFAGAVGVEEQFERAILDGPAAGFGIRSNP